VALKNEYTLKIFETEVLRKISGCKGRRNRRLRKAKESSKIKENEMGDPCLVHG
jgi:hypothetical protein